MQNNLQCYVLCEHKSVMCATAGMCEGVFYCTFEYKTQYVLNYSFVVMNTFTCELC